MTDPCRVLLLRRSSLRSRHRGVDAQSARRACRRSRSPWPARRRRRSTSAAGGRAAHHRRAGHRRRARCSAPRDLLVVSGGTGAGRAARPAVLRPPREPVRPRPPRPAAQALATTAAGSGSSRSTTSTAIAAVEHVCDGDLRRATTSSRSSAPVDPGRAPIATTRPASPISPSLGRVVAGNEDRSAWRRRRLRADRSRQRAGRRRQARGRRSTATSASPGMPLAAVGEGVVVCDRRDDVADADHARTGRGAERRLRRAAEVELQTCSDCHRAVPRTRAYR